MHQQEPPILHRDIKPANIIVPSDGGNAALVDFGTAKEYLPENTTSMFRCGTPGYAAIEQYSLNSITDIRTDIYGFGATLYTLLTGVKPLDALERLMTKKGHDALQPVHELVPAIPPFVSQAIERALSIYYVDRFATMEEFWHALHHDIGKQAELALRDGKKSIAIKRSASVPGKQKNTRFGRRNLIALFSLLLLVLGVGAGLLFSFTHAAPHQSSPRSALSPTSAAASPTKVTFPYPSIATSYAGTISDIAVAHKETTLYIMQIHQDRQNISGNFQGLGLVGSFIGTVTSTGSVHFIASYGAGSLIFDGKIKVGGDMEGTFNAVDPHGQNLEEYGPWYASATSS
jgi:serine/threonine protein kinase